MASVMILAFSQVISAQTQLRLTLEQMRWILNVEDVTVCCGQIISDQYQEVLVIHALITTSLNFSKGST